MVHANQTELFWNKLITTFSTPTREVNIHSHKISIFHFVVFLRRHDFFYLPMRWQVYNTWRKVFPFDMENFSNFQVNWSKILTSILLTSSKPAVQCFEHDTKNLPVDPLLTNNSNCQKKKKPNNNNNKKLSRETSSLPRVQPVYNCGVCGLQSIIY